MLAARGTRKSNGGEEAVSDAAQAEALRRRGRAVTLKAVATTLVSTAAVYLLA